jgi:hypothetical protein
VVVRRTAIKLVDAVPHPNAVQAGWGRRRHRLAVDPVAAEHVRWIFARRLDGWSAAGIARVLNERRVLSPGVYDLARNRHREGTVWTLRTVAAMPANPRYTGRQVWNRQFTDHREAVPGDRRTSAGPVRIWNSRADWVVHRERTHRALVGDEDFTAVQEITARATSEGGQRRRYALAGLLVCWSAGLCGVRAATVGALGERPGRLPLPPWAHQRPAGRRGRAALGVSVRSAPRAGPDRGEPRTGRSGGCRRRGGVSEKARDLVVVCVTALW